jgi:hypothetical protein
MKTFLSNEGEQESSISPYSYVQVLQRSELANKTEFDSDTLSVCILANIDRYLARYDCGILLLT